LNRQESKFAKEIAKIAKKPWRHKENLGVLCGLAVGKNATV
jgi:hypothetical protein